MTQKDKELLLKDLCGRLPYGVKAKYYDPEAERTTCDEIDDIYNTTSIDHVEVGIGQYGLHLTEVKPYLFPISSMTEEQYREFYNIFPNSMHFSHTTRNELVIYTDPEYDCDHAFESFVEMQDWLNSHHFDYRGLIGKSLALDATGLNVY